MLLMGYHNYFFLLCVIFSLCNNAIIQATPTPPSNRTAYYFSVEGNDANDGSITHPLKTISFLNALTLKPGDSILLKGGDSFMGNIIIHTNGTKDKPVVITSYNNQQAVIDGLNGTALTVNQASYINIENINCKGSGRKDGNTTHGFAVNYSDHIYIKNIDIRGFQKAGLSVYVSADINIDSVHAHDNGFAGISIDGDYGKKLSTHNIIITNCDATNNPGDPANLTNHSGNGIIAGNCCNVLIDHCSATNNGWDMPRIGNGPVGIWCYEADSVIIQHCISYRNKTSKGGEDGGGYDFDGGTTNSIIQYCLSYENAGSAFGIFQYAGASKWENNIIRFCISENDGKVSAAHAGAYVWNSSHDSTQFKNFLFYNNTIYNDSGAAISYSVESDHSNFKFYKNIFVGADELLKGQYGSDVFLGNNWWSLKSNFNIDGEHNFESWCKVKSKEQLDGVIKGSNIDPSFKNAGHADITNANWLSGFNNYFIKSIPTVTQSGLDLQALFTIDVGDKDFNGQPVDKHYSGACSGK